MNIISLYNVHVWTRTKRFWMILMISLFSFAGVAALVLLEKTVWFDNLVTEWVRGFETPFVTSIAKGFTFLGSTAAIIMICLAIALWMYTVLQFRREALFFIIVVLGSSILNVILKQIFRRIRPDLGRLIEITGYSFPSGHSMAAFTLYGILTYLLWKHLARTGRRYIVLIIFSIMVLSIGLSRIYLGVHYPSDVIGGYLASCTWLMFMIVMYERRQRQIA